MVRIMLDTNGIECCCEPLPVSEDEQPEEDEATETE